MPLFIGGPHDGLIEDVKGNPELIFKVDWNGVKEVKHTYVRHTLEMAGPGRRRVKKEAVYVHDGMQMPGPFDRLLQHYHES